MIFGREPALWSAATRALIILVTTFLFPLTIAQQGSLNAAVAALLGVIVAFQVHAEKAVPFLLGLIEAVIYLAVSFGLQLDPEQQSVVMGVVVAVFAVWTRDRVVAPIDENGDRRVLESVTI